jgi:hypothetical protein
MRLEALTAVTMSTLVFCVVTPCGFEDTRFQKKISLSPSSGMKIERVGLCSPEMLISNCTSNGVTTQNTGMNNSVLAYISPTERRSRAVDTPASYMECPEFKSRPEGQLL